MSDPTFSNIDFKNKMALVCTTLKSYFRYHFLHSLALFTVQFSSVPKITAALFIAGQLLFCVPAYSNGLGVVAIDDPKLYAMPFGGTSFMVGWASHAL